ncbi:hypothetical protein D3C71_2177450 [compost metagenome]
MIAVINALYAVTNACADVFNCVVLVDTVMVDLPSAINSRLTPLSTEEIELEADSIFTLSSVYSAFCGTVVTT